MYRKIIYASRAIEPMSDRQLDEILTVAHARNSSHSVTGMLLYSAQSFLQLIEGPDAPTAAIYQSISNDSRHGDLRVLSNMQSEERMFSDWSMGFRRVDRKELGETLAGYTATDIYPFLTPEIVTSARVAEKLLARYAGIPQL